MLDIEYILFALERKSTGAQRSKENTYQLLSVGAVHLALAGAHVLLSIGGVAFIQYKDRL